MALKLFTVLLFLLNFWLISSGKSPIHPRFNIANGSSRIIDGTQATMEATRYLASLRTRVIDSEDYGSGHICSGSLITPNMVLTSASCLVDPHYDFGIFVNKEDLIVVMGNVNMFEKENTLSFDIEQIIVQVKQLNSNLEKDIALLKLAGSVPANHPTIQPIGLAAVFVPAGTICQVTGWGVTEEGGLSDTLRTVDVPILSKKECDDETYVGDFTVPGMVCAGATNGGGNSCSGDVGGPLVCQGQLSGVVTFGFCGRPRFPSIYTEVPYYYDWIVEQIAEHSSA